MVDFLSEFEVYKASFIGLIFLVFLIFPLVSPVVSAHFDRPLLQSYFAFLKSSPILLLWWLIPEVNKYAQVPVFLVILWIFISLVLYRLGCWSWSRLGCMILLSCAAVLGIPGFSFDDTLRSIDDWGNVFAPLVHLTRLYARGQLPLWNDVNWMGHPLAADPMWGIWYPLNQFFALFMSQFENLRGNVPLDQFLRPAFFYFRFASVWTSLIGMYVLLRSLRFRRPVSFAAAVIFPMWPFLQIQFFWTFSLAPWIFLGLLQVIEHRKKIWILWLGLIFGFALLGGQMQSILYVTYTFLPISAVMIWHRRTEWKSLARSLAKSAAVAIVIGGVLWLPAAQYLRESIRWLGDGDTIDGTNRLTYSQTLVGAFSGWSEFYRDLLGRVSQAHLLVALGGLIFWNSLKEPRWRSSHKSVRWALVAVMAILVCDSLGDVTPIHKVLFYLAPAWSSFRLLSRANWILIFPLSLLVASGLQLLIESVHRKSKAWKTLVSAGVVAFGMTGVSRQAALINASFKSMPTVPQDSQDLSTLRNFDALFNRDDPTREPFRVQFFTEEAHYYAGFLFGWATTNAYGGIALKRGADIVWSDQDWRKNLKYLVFDDGTMAKVSPPQNAIFLSKNGKFSLFEMSDFTPRFFWKDGPHEKADAIHVLYAGPMRMSVEVETHQERQMLVSTAYFQNWWARQGWKLLPVTRESNIMSVTVPGQDQKRRIDFFYFDPVVICLGLLSLFIWLKYLTEVVREARGKTPLKESP